MTDFDTLLGDHRVIVILRGMSPESTVEMASRAWDAGVGAVEVPIGEPGQEEALAAAVRAGARGGHPVGAGTVVSAEHVVAAARAGAAYTVAPGLDEQVLEASRKTGMPHLPGVATATEIQNANKAGCQWVKVFPAHSLGTGWLRAMRGPFPHLKAVVTGGIGVEQVEDYLNAGAQVVGLGSVVSDAAAVRRLAEVISHRSR